MDPLNIKEKEEDPKKKKLSTNSTLFNNLLELVKKVLTYLTTQVFIYFFIFLLFSFLINKPMERDDWNCQKAAAACLSLLTESGIFVFNKKKKRKVTRMNRISYSL